MKSVISAGLILCLVGCAGSTSETAKTSPFSGHQLTDAEVGGIVHETMQRIQADLKELKSQFPQLSEIDTASVTSNHFDYCKGWVEDSKVEGVTFMKDGCDIAVWTRYPAKSADAQTQLRGSPFLRLANGKYLIFWRSVGAENTEQAKAFKIEVDRVLSERIPEMLKQLGNGPKDFVYRLPNEERAPNSPRTIP